MAEEKRKGGGGKLARSETVTVRLDPKLRYLAELAARKQRRTVSSFIEWAVAQSFKEVDLYQGTGYNGDDDITIEHEAARLWDIDEAERFVKLAISYPDLLTHDEQVRWKVLTDSGILTQARKRSGMSKQVFWQWDILEDYVFPALRREWDSLNRYIEDGKGQEWVEATQKALKAGMVFHAKPPTLVEDDDPDIPF
ncbi:MAG: hypothetical protein JNK92_06125 [Dechloromonas sp.]|nr:hypothetical protein [Dechloromonas sp.]